MNAMHAHKTFYKRSMRIGAQRRGFAIVEALVAALIFSFGVLGVIGLQVHMTHATTVAKYRADAMNLAQELIGVMWSNYPDVMAYDSGTGNCGSIAHCQQWMDKVARELPGGTATINVAASAVAGGGLVSVTLNWNTKLGPQSYQTRGAVVPQACLTLPSKPCV